jgi:hypothetical protein
MSLLSFVIELMNAAEFHELGIFGGTAQACYRSAIR